MSHPDHLKKCQSQQQSRNYELLRAASKGYIDAEHKYVKDLLAHGFGDGTIDYIMNEKDNKGGTLEAQRANICLSKKKADWVLYNWIHEMSTLKQDENDAVTALTQRMDRLCSEMDSVRQENVQLHARIAQLEEQLLPTAEVEPPRCAEKMNDEAIEAEAQRRIKEMKDEEMARELADLWRSSEDVEQHQRDRAAQAAEARYAAARNRGGRRRV